jgi:hypothetical protein
VAILGDYVDANQIEAQNPKYRDVYLDEQADKPWRRSGKKPVS